jgi:SAM-dependent methyltransferase
VTLEAPDADLLERLNRHYGREGLIERLDRALRGAGKNPDQPTCDDLAPFDQLHVGGIDMTRDLARQAVLPPRSHVLDVGAGIGGPARTLAREFDLEVTGIDATREFVRAAQVFNRRTGLSDRVRVLHGSALATPFAGATFDGAFLIHVSMNVRDKPALFGEIARVLKPGAPFALFDIIGGSSVTPLHYPVPWSPDDGASFLIPRDEYVASLARAGFAQRAWNDLTAFALEWLRTLREKASAAQRESVAPATPATLGADQLERIANLERNLAEDRAAVVQAIFDRR